MIKNIFRKAMTVAGSAALIGMTVGAASAASYPDPFTSNTAIIVGANAAPSDNIAASSIASNLDAASAGSSLGGTTTVTGGDSFKFEKASTKFHLGDTITGVVSSSLDDNDLPTLLADGKFIDDDNDEFDFKQTITMTNEMLVMFDDNDYKRDTPTVGFHYANGEAILDYTLDFVENPLWDDLTTTDLTFMGKEYYVLSTSGNNTLTLLDSAKDTLLTEGETATLNVDGTTYTVSIDFISSTEAKLTVNGEVTNSISEGETYKLSDGSYLGLKDILYSAKDSGVSKVEFSIGAGKLVLASGSEVELNEEDIDNLDVTITSTASSSKLDTVVLSWDADDDMFVTTDNSITMPGFGAVSLSFGGLTYPAEETIVVAANGDNNIELTNFPLKDVTRTIDLLESDGSTYTIVGKDSDNILRTAGPGKTLNYSGDTDDYFVLSYMSGDDAESYLVKATGWDDTNFPSHTVNFEYLTDSGWKNADSGVEEGDSLEIGNAVATVGSISNETQDWVTLTATGTSNFHMLYSAEGLEVWLPWIGNATDTYSAGYINSSATAATFQLRFEEEDKDDAISSGDMINVTVGLDGDSEVTISSYATSNTDASASEIGESDVYRDFTYSALATEILDDQSGDHETWTLMYHGGEVEADVYITSSDAVVTSDTEAGVMTYTDAEASMAAGMNVVVVGGSAINSVAAELLGGAFSEAAFTTATGVAAGEFLIESFDRSGDNALLVAGYNAPDTTKAVTYLLNNDVDTTVGMKYVGTSATEASLVVA